jgi:hypothetical protein
MTPVFSGNDFGNGNPEANPESRIDAFDGLSS